MNLIDMDRLRKELMAKGDIPIHEVFNTIWEQPIVKEQQSSEDCISRLIVQEEITKSIALKENPHQMYKRIQAIPSVTPQRPKGKWSRPSVVTMPYSLAYECPICRKWGNIQTFKPNYCPNCGAKMEGEE